MAELYASNGTEFTKLPIMTAETTTDTEYNNHFATGFYSIRGVPSTNGTSSVPFGQWGSVLSDNSIGTPWQIAIPDGANNLYIYKRAQSSNTWSKMSAGYADSAGTATSANHATSAGSADNEYSIMVQDTQPTDSRCKLWIQP